MESNTSFILHRRVRRYSGYLGSQLAGVHSLKNIIILMLVIQYYKMYHTLSYFPEHDKCALIFL